MTTKEEVEVLSRAEVDARLAEANTWHGLLAPFVIQNDEEQEKVASVLADVKKRLKHLDEQRKTITAPLYQAWTATNDLFRPPKQKLEELEKLCKDKIKAYLNEKQARNQRSLQAAAVAPTPHVAQQHIASVSPVEPPKGVTVREVWKMEIENPDLVPRELCSPDVQKIWARVQGVAEPSVPGVRFYKDSVVTARSGR